jgi:hypothetical protein
MIEWFLIIGIIFIILIVFYKQANEEFTILQLEGNQLATLTTVLSEKNPIVIKQVQIPPFFTPDAIQQNKRIQSFPLAQQKTLIDALTSTTIQTTPESSAILARESGLQVWAEHTWFPYLTNWWFLHTMKTSANCGEHGLTKTTAPSTVILPTSNTLDVYIMTGSQEKYFPKLWAGKFPETFTVLDTPLVGQVKYMVIKVKAGNALCLPAHWFYSIRSSDSVKPILWCLLECHHPLSTIAASLEST